MIIFEDAKAHSVLGRQCKERRTGIRLALVVGLVVLGLGAAIAYAASVEISREVPGSVTINLVTHVPLPTSSPVAPGRADAVLDVDRSGRIDSADLRAIAIKIGTTVIGEVKEDVNGDGSVDVLDLAGAASHFGQEARA